MRRTVTRHTRYAVLAAAAAAALATGLAPAGAAARTVSPARTGNGRRAEPRSVTSSK